MNCPFHKGLRRISIRRRRPPGLPPLIDSFVHVVELHPHGRLLTGASSSLLRILSDHISMSSLFDPAWDLGAFKQIPELFGIIGRFILLCYLVRLASDPASGSGIWRFPSVHPQLPVSRGQAGSFCSSLSLPDALEDPVDLLLKFLLLRVPGSSTGFATRGARRPGIGPRGRMGSRTGDSRADLLERKGFWKSPYPARELDTSPSEQVFSEPPGPDTRRS
jgi:hypothetical protein